MKNSIGATKNPIILFIEKPDAGKIEFVFISAMANDKVKL